MNGSSKILATHRQRQGVVYIRQSDPKQVLKNRESGFNQRALQERLLELGWGKNQVVLIDEDQGRSGKHASGRDGFQALVADVSLRKVGIILGYEVSRLSRNNADWHRLLELCAMFDTLIGDSDGIYQPRDFNDRLLLGLKGTMSEAELHSLRLRLIACPRLENPEKTGSSTVGIVRVGFIIGNVKNPIRIDKNPIRKSDKMAFFGLVQISQFPGNTTVGRQSGAKPGMQCVATHRTRGGHLRAR
jgi:Resolvase, N terminal domain